MHSHMHCEALGYGARAKQASRQRSDTKIHISIKCCTHFYVSLSHWIIKVDLFVWVKKIMGARSSEERHMGNIPREVEILAQLSGL